MRNLAAVTIVALALLWPAFVNGEPFYMPDTPSYLRGADGAIHELTGTSSSWSGELQKRFADPSVDSEVQGPSNAAAGANAAADKLATNGTAEERPLEPEVVLKGRSIYYGALLYAAQWPGNFWIMAVFQALLCAVAIMLTIRTLRQSFGPDTKASTALGTGLVVAALTPLGYFATYLLPDVLGGLGLLAAGHLLFFWDRSGGLSRLFWFALLALALLSHTANILLIVSLAIIALVSLPFRVPANREGLAALLGTIAIGLIGQAIFSWGVERATGAPPIRPPFLAARIIEDGPGYEYLRQHCPEVKLIYCRTLEFRQRDSNSLLWSVDPREGIFQALEPVEERQAASQQTEFVLAVLKERPLDLVRSSVSAFFSQLGYFSLESFNYTPSNIRYFDNKLPPPFLEHARQSRAYQDNMPVAFTEWATIVSVLVSLVAILWAVRSDYRREKRLTPLTSFLLLLLLGVLANAAICGTFSTPTGRYQMRLIWVLPLAAMAACRVRSNRLGKVERMAGTPAETVAAN